MSQIKPFIAAVIRRCKSFFRSVKRAILWLLWKIRAFFHALLLSIRLLALRAAVFFLSFVSSATYALAASKGAGGFTKATTEITSYQTPVSNLMKAIAAVIVLVGAFNVYFKMRAYVKGFVLNASLARG